MKLCKKLQKGFTMVELSIVLVIIGLIVAGVLVGQDLIRGAEVRATVSQLERFSATVNTFRVKFTQIPGDINKAVDFGLNDPDDTTGRVGGNGDANGLLSTFQNGDAITITQTNPINEAKGEITNFWFHLSRASLIEGNFNGAQQGNGQLSETFPRTKMNRGGFTVYNKNGVNHFHLGVTNSNGTNHSFANNLRPEEAYGIDVKIDDGFPERGATLAITGDFTEWNGCVPGSTTDPCANTSTASGDNTGCMFDPDGNGPKEKEYDLFSTGLLCQLRVRMN